MTAYIKLDKDNHEMLENGIQLHTIYGDVFVPARHYNLDKDTNILTVPAWLFYGDGLNPCQMVTGFIKQEHTDTADFSLNACMKAVKFDVEFLHKNPFEELGRAITRAEQDVFFNKTMIDAWKKYIADNGLTWNEEVA